MEFKVIEGNAEEVEKKLNHLKRKSTTGLTIEGFATYNGVITLVVKCREGINTPF